MNLPQLKSGLVVAFFLLASVKSFGAHPAVNAEPAAIFARDDDMDEVWRKTHINFSLISYYAEFVHPCRQNALNLLSCVHLVNALGAQVHPRFQLVPKSFTHEDPENSGTKILSLGDYDFVRTEHEGNPAERLNIPAYKGLLRARFDHGRAAAAASLDHVTTDDFLALAYQLLRRADPGAIKQKLIVNAVNAMITTFDSHGGLFLRAEDWRAQIDPDERIAGIGAEIRPVKEGLLLVKVYPDTGAEAAGLRDGDVITAIAGVPTAHQRLEDLVRKLHGPPGSHVRVNVLRESTEIDITRSIFAVVKVPPARYVENFGAKVAVLQLIDFRGQDTAERLAERLRGLDRQTRALILDLRGNGGGLVDQAVAVAGEFLGAGKPILIQREIDRGSLTGNEMILQSRRGPLTDLPLVVLVDQRSASASEIVAGAIQDYRRGFLLGTRTFGKGSMQQIGAFTPRTASSPNSMVWLAQWGELDEHWTVARFYQPGGHTNQAVGLQPDFEVFGKPSPTSEEREFFTEADENPNALPAAGELWRQPRQAMIDELQNHCFKDRGAEKLLDEAPYAESVDYQMLKAEELLACQLVPKSLQVGKSALAPTFF